MGHRPPSLVRSPVFLMGPSVSPPRRREGAHQSTGYPHPAGYCKFAYGDETLFPNGKTVSLRDQKIDHDENVTTEPGGRPVCSGGPSCVHPTRERGGG